MRNTFRMSSLWLLIFLICTCCNLLAGTIAALQYPALVIKFYAVAAQQLFWMDKSADANGLRSALLRKLDSAAYQGINNHGYHYDQLVEKCERAIDYTDSLTVVKLDELLTDAAIAYCKDLYQGSGIGSWVTYDEFSKKYEDDDNKFLLTHLVAIRSAGELESFLHSLEPETMEYMAIKAELKAQLANNESGKIAKLATSVNFYRWVHHFKFERYIVVNIGAANLRYYEHGAEVLFSRMIVGKPATKTPRFAANCNQVILYPYWNVPRSIALKELLPRYKKAPSRIDAENMQMLNEKGAIVDPYAIQWSKYNSKYFPFRFRQSTGCDNSLGVIKFNLTSPFDVYLHDTNTKGLFSSKNRYRSHGCMRVEKALDLGNILLNSKLDTTYLQSCINGEKPVTVKLDKPVPVFVEYVLSDVSDNGTISYYDDIYRLLGK